MKPRTQRFAMFSASFATSKQRSSSCRAVVSGRELDAPFTEHGPTGERLAPDTRSGDLSDHPALVIVPLDRPRAMPAAACGCRAPPPVTVRTCLRSRGQTARRASRPSPPGIDARRRADGRDSRPSRTVDFPQALTAETPPLAQRFEHGTRPKQRCKGGAEGNQEEESHGSLSSLRRDPAPHGPVSTARGAGRGLHLPRRGPLRRASETRSRDRAIRATRSRSFKTLTATAQLRPCAARNLICRSPSRRAADAQPRERSTAQARSRASPLPKPQ